MVTATHQHRKGDAGKLQATTEDCQPLSPRAFYPDVFTLSLDSQLPVCVKRPVAFEPQHVDGVHGRLFVVVVSMKKRHLGPKCIPGGIEHATGAGSQLNEKGAVPVAVIWRRVKLHLENTRDLDLVYYHPVNTALVKP
jgi:hypothetical protein